MSEPLYSVPKPVPAVKPVPVAPLPVWHGGQDLALPEKLCARCGLTRQMHREGGDKCSHFVETFHWIAILPADLATRRIVNAYMLDPHAEHAADWALRDSTGGRRGERMKWSYWRSAMLGFLYRYGESRGDEITAEWFRSCVGTYMMIASEHARYGGYWRPEQT